MTTLRNEILPVKELKKRYSVNNVILLQCSSEKQTSTIEKTIIAKRGFSKVTGLQIVDVRNPRFDSKRVNEVNPISGCKYIETAYRTETTWIFE
jgi:hypothetical protein